MQKIVVFFFLVFSAIGSAQDSYALSSESELTIEGTSTVHSWVVSANNMSGIIEIDQELLATIEFEVVVSEIKSERGATMDSKMHAALKKEEYPKVIFTLEEVEDKSTLKGLLTIAGTEKQVEIQVKTTIGDSGIKIKGLKKIVLQDFGIEPPTAMFGQIIVGDDVTVKFDLVFHKQ